MANTFITPELVARETLANLYERLVMLPLVHTDHSVNFTAGVGDTVNVRKPAVLEASDFVEASGIQLQDVTESSVPVKLDKIADISVPVTSKQMTLDIADFNQQIVEPAAKGLARHINRRILDLRSQVVAEVGTGSGFEWNKPEVLIAADEALNLKNVPNDERFAVVGASTRAQWLNNEIIKHADKSGSTSALREGSLGRNLFGFETFMTQQVGQPATSPAVGDPTTEVGVAFHKTAFAFVSAPLELPEDEGFATIQSYEGINLRIVKKYDITKKRTVISFDVLYGTTVLDANRAVLLKGADQT
ncbi:P22 phage major capsid protein family protein [Prescottella equi]|uniref:P22 phage major capsid protein family protein n=1 Tax=Rhodococcus hoagii TaxID=43767 RepID=UPI001EEA7100|nr:P22 phage major capsid protein family protein [Prescottella equi]